MTTPVTPSGSTALVKQVARRLRWITFFRRLYRALLVGCIIGGIALLAVRLTGLAPRGADLWLTWLPVALACLVALIWRKQTTDLEAARLIDQTIGAKDLFLTALLIEKAPGDFKPLVTRDAEALAKKTSPVAVAPLTVPRRAWNLVGAVAMLLLGFSLIEQLDPFGNVQAADAVAEQKAELAEAKKKTERRIADLRQEQEDREEEAQVDAAIDQLEEKFKNLQPLQKERNLAELTATQKPLVQLWKQASADKLQKALDREAESQQLGGEIPEHLEKWTKELQEGMTDSAQQELEQLAEDLQRLMKSEDPVEQQEMLEKIRQRMEDLQDFAEEKAGAKPLSAALQQALQQLQMAKKEGLSTEALEAAAKSMDLSKLELQEVQQSLEDLKKLEQALKTLQMAKQANQNDKLDESACENCKNCKSMAEYEALYAKLTAGQKPGEEEGPGMGGPGRGKGNSAPEDDSQQTAFKTEQSKSQVTAGKVLLSLKTKGLSDSGEADVEFRAALSEIKQGYSEAILQEQIPPGYHERIKSYFDGIERAAPAPAP